MTIDLNNSVCNNVLDEWDNEQDESFGSGYVGEENNFSYREELNDGVYTEENNEDISSDLNRSQNNVETETEHMGVGDDTNFDSESLCREIENKLEVGSTVESLDQAYLLYCEYGRRCGFSVRKGDQVYCFGTTEIRAKEYKCSCEGLHDDKRSNGKVATYKKQNTRTDCKARIRFVREKLNEDVFLWKVQKFYKEHNHELVPSHQSYMLRSARQLSHAKQSLVEALKSAGIGVSRAYRFLEKECGGPDNIGFTKKDAYDHLSKQNLKTSVENVDSNALVQFFVRKSIDEPFFYWNVQLDDEGRLMNFFFRDSRCLIDYEHFGDVLSVDTTYKTNKYDLICAPFVGINHHMRNVMFGLAFLSNETTISFEWLFSCFLESMHGREPQTIFSDQSAALMAGIDATFRTAKHRLCQWHINRNAPSHFGALNGNKQFKKQWHYCMNGVENESEFEASWTSMIQSYSLKENSWFKSMYKLRKRWASVFTNTCFSAGLLATSRSEVTNKVLKDLCSASSSLTEFVEQYQQIVVDWRTRENADDFSNIGTPGIFVSTSLLLSQASKILTRNVFKAFEGQFALGATVVIIQPPQNVNCVDLVYQVASQPSMKRVRHVSFNTTSHRASCSCRMWETEGVICRHIFRVYLDKNVTQLPEFYFLHRWKKVAKQRHPQVYSGQCQLNGDGFIDEMAFVNYIMRLTLELCDGAKVNRTYRQQVVETITKLKKKLETGGTQKHVSVGGDVVMKVRDPKSKRDASHIGTTPKSHWQKRKKMSGSRCPIPKWPVMECSEQTESVYRQSTQFTQTTSSISQLNETRRGLYHENISNEANSQWSDNESLNEPIDVTSIFEMEDQWSYVQFSIVQMAPKPIDQDLVFYTGKWSRYAESVALAELDEEKWRGNWVSGADEDNLASVERVRKYVVNRLGVEFTKEEFVAKINEWKHRFEMFSWLLERVTTFGHNSMTNEIKQTEEAWTQTEKEWPAVLVYMKEGEEEWPRLKSLFEVVEEPSEASDFNSDATPLSTDQDNEVEIALQSTKVDDTGNADLIDPNGDAVYISDSEEENSKS